MRFLVFGSMNIDLLFFVDHIVLGGETISSHDFQYNAGGKGANQSAAMGKAGLDISFVGKCNDEGRKILNLLNSYGVDTSLSIVTEEVTTGQALIQIDRNGQNSIILNPGGNHALTIEEAESVLSHFSKGDVIILQNEINITGEVIALAKKKGMTVVLNPSPYDEKINTFPLSDVDYFFVNEWEAAYLLGEKTAGKTDADFRRMARKINETLPGSKVILTAGSNGAYYAEDGNVLYSPIVDAKVVDTTGAGDTFCGYFLSAAFTGMTKQEALDYASMASAIAVSRLGAMAGMPFKKEVDEALGL